MCQFTDRKELHNSFLYILQAIVPLFQDLPCSFQILRILRAFVPGKRKKGLDISTENTALRCIGAGDLEASDFLENTVLHFLGRSQFSCFPTEFLCLISSIILPKLLTDQLQLLSQNIFTLVLIHPLLQLLLKVMADVQHIDLIAENCAKKLISVRQLSCLQKLLLALPGKRQVYCDLVNQLLCLLAVENLGSQFLAYFAPFGAVGMEKLPDASVHSLEHCLRQFLFFLVSQDDLRPEIGCLLLQSQKFCSSGSFHKDTQQIVRKFDNLFDICHGSYLKKLHKARIFNLWILLCHQKNLLILEHCSLNGFLGTLPAYIEMDDHAREYGSSAKRDGRKYIDRLTHLSSGPFFTLFQECLSCVHAGFFCLYWKHLPAAPEVPRERSEVHLFPPQLLL